jgi:hypothetical protein
MDETRIDVTNLENVPAAYDDDISELQAQLTRIRALQASSGFSDDSARTDVLQSSPARSTLHLASLSSDPHERLRSPFTDGSPTTAAAGLDIPSVSSVVHQENAMFRKRIEELESVSVCASTPASPVSMPLDQPAGILDSHLRGTH